MEYDISSEVKAAIAINFAAHADISDGNNIDTKGFESIVFVIMSGAVGAGTADFVLQEADDNGSGAPGTWNAVAAADLIGSLPTIATANDNVVHRVGYRGKKRWLRLQNVETATWTTHNHGAIAILGHAKEVPVTAQ